MGGEGLHPANDIMVDIAGTLRDEELSPRVKDLLHKMYKHLSPAEEPKEPVPVAHAMQQGDRIKGYRKMTEEELALFNEGKELALLVGAYVKKLEENKGIVDMPFRGNQNPIPGTRPCDQRWVAIGKTQLQQGFMAIYRGIAQPEGF